MSAKFTVTKNFSTWEKGIDQPKRAIYVSMSDDGDFASAAISADEARDIAARLNEAADAHEEAVARHEAGLKNPFRDMAVGTIFYAQWINADGSIFEPKYGPYRHDSEGKNIALDGWSKGADLDDKTFEDNYKITVIWPEPVND